VPVEGRTCATRRRAPPFAFAAAFCDSLAVPRKIAIVALILALGAAGVHAEDAVPAGRPAAGSPPSATAAPAAKPTPPLTPEQAADAALVAVKAKDDAVLKALADKDEPAPWLVADELIRRGEVDAADAFANAAPRADVAKLPAYVAPRRGQPDDPARRRPTRSSGGSKTATCSWHTECSATTRWPSFSRAPTRALSRS
jgi:hypothetical protein